MAVDAPAVPDEPAVNGEPGVSVPAPVSQKVSTRSPDTGAAPRAGEALVEADAFEDPTAAWETDPDRPRNTSRENSVLAAPVYPVQVTTVPSAMATGVWKMKVCIHRDDAEPSSVSRIVVYGVPLTASWTEMPLVTWPVCEPAQTTMTSPAWMPVPAGIVAVQEDAAAPPLMLAELTRVTTAGHLLVRLRGGSPPLSVLAVQLHVLGGDRVAGRGRSEGQVRP